MFDHICSKAATQEQQHPSPPEARSLVRVLKALGDATRISILDLLMEGTQCNCELAERLDLSPSLLSHHLRVLRLAGLIQGQRDPDDERWIYYSVDRAVIEEMGALLGHLLDVRRIQPRSPLCGPKGCGLHCK
jgi:ArsR family transcriptional regulator